MQSFYGMAIRQKLNDKYGMEKVIGGKSFHCTDIKDPKSRHYFCSPGEESWWKYKITKMDILYYTTSIWCTDRWQVIVEMFSWWEAKPKWVMK